MIEPSLKSDIYDINNMVSLGFHPQSIRKAPHVDTSSWRNQSNIIVPDSKYLPTSHVITSQERFSTRIEESEEELTDDEIYLERHQRALKTIIQQ